MSKHVSASKQIQPSAKTTCTYWRRRVFRNSYTHQGRRYWVKHWSVKIQVAGRRRTWSLNAPTRAAAAQEALERFLGLQKGSMHQAKAPIPEPLPMPRPRLLIRPHVPVDVPSGELSAHFEIDGQHHYFPLGTTDPKQASRRARVIHSTLGQVGLQATEERFSQEHTLALEWSANPLVWTYFTVYTQPTRSEPELENVAHRREQKRLVREVSLVETNPGLRHALVDALNRHDVIRCNRAMGSSSEALSVLAQDPPALLLLNQSLDGTSASQFLDRLERLRPGIPSLTYAAYDDSDHVFRATPGGADGYFLKRTSADRLLDPLTDIPATTSLTKADLPAAAFRWFQKLTDSTQSTSHRPDLARLTAREHEILALLSQGFLDKEIAHQLQISIWTVHGHAKSIYEKLGVHSRTEAAVKYLQK